MMRLPPLNRSLEAQLRQKVDGKAKPPGSLGRLEDLAVHIGLIRQSLSPTLGSAGLVVFAGDHGIVDEGVAAYPSSVSAIIAQMILKGVAGANVAAQAVGADVFLASAGLAASFEAHPRLLHHGMGKPTRNFAHEPAMTDAELETALEAGFSVSQSLRDKGYGILALGEVGIGNTSSAALIGHAITGIDLEALVGPGAGVPPLGLAHKRNVLRRSFQRSPVSDARSALCEFGGFELVMMIGGMFGAASLGLVVLIDGFVATAAACAAVSLNPNLRDYLIFTHLSAEPGHAFLLQKIGAKPLLSLEMRLGEATGAALSIPMIRMAENMLRDMADLSSVLPA